MIKVAVLHKSCVVYDALTRLLCEDSEITAVSAHNKPLDTVISSKPDILFVDSFLLPELASVLANKAIKILVLDAGQMGDPLVPFVFEQVAGVITPDTSSVLLKKAIKAVANGEVWIERRCMKNFIEKSRSLLNMAEEKGLSKREKEIGSLVVKGYRNKAIAEQLYISEQTVKSHLNKIYKKLGVKSRINLAIFFSNLLPSTKLLR